MRFALFLILLLPAAALEEGFTSLFNSRNLDGWKVVNGDGKYTVQDDSIVGTGKNLRRNTFLRTEKEYRDFDLRFETKFLNLDGNSGVMFRAQQKDGGEGRVFGYQCEHDNRKERAWTAGLYDEARRGWLFPSKKEPSQTAAFTKQGQEIIKWNDWNEVRILCEGPRIRIYLNGELRVDFTDEGEHSTPEGFLGLQVHSGKSCQVAWRNLRIREL